MQWIWDPEKNDENQRKHSISFETAGLVFDDPLHIPIEDPYEDEAKLKPRWDVHLSGDADQLS